MILEFGDYLDYRGVPVEGAADEGSSRGKVLLAEARHIRAKNSPRGTFEDGPCVEWQRIWCRVVSEPAPGELVVVLPDDRASLAEAAVYREGGKLLFLLSLVHPFRIGCCGYSTVFLPEPGVTGTKRAPIAGWTRQSQYGSTNRPQCLPASGRLPGAESPSQNRAC